MRVEWPTFLLIIVCYGSWFVAGFWLFDIAPIAALIVMAVMSAFHSSLTHEAIHGHPTKYIIFNEALLFLPLSLLHPYRRYRQTHRQHHRNQILTDPFEDPESYYWAAWQHKPLPIVMKHLLILNNTMLGRIIMGPLLSFFAFFASEFQLVRQKAPGVRLAWCLHVPAAALVILMVQMMGIPLWVYGVAVCWPALSLISLRSYAEHRWHEAPEGRTIIVEKSPLAWLYLYNNLHLVHHTHPKAPWYELPALYQAEKQQWAERNDSYVYPNYMALWRDFAFRAKEPVVHPASIESQ